MPRVIEALAPRTGRPAQYPWDEWLDGKAREFVRGSEDEVEAKQADFACKLDSFQSQARRQAEDRDLRLTVRTIDEDEGIVQLQAFRKTEQESPKPSADMFNPDAPGTDEVGDTVSEGGLEVEPVDDTTDADVTEDEQVYA